MKKTWVAFAGIMLVAVFFMFWRYERYPLSMLAQEGCCGLSALKVLEGDREWIARFWEKPLNTQRGGAAGSHSCENNPFIIYPTAGFIKWFGCDHTYLTLRLTSMLYGCLSVAMLYLLVARMFNRGAGLIAAFLLATSPWALGFSRVSGEYSASVFFSLVCFYLFHVLKPSQHLGYIALGALMSLATYFYGMARIVVPVVVFSQISNMALVRDYVKEHYQGFIFIIVGLYFGLSIQGGGLETYFRQNVAWDWSVFNDRAQVSKRLASNLDKTYQRLFVDWGWNEEDGGVVERSAALDPVTRWCFAIGIIWGLVRIGRSPYRFLFIWLILALLPVIITGAEFRRGCMAPPAIYALAGVGIEHTLRLMTARLGRYRAAVAAVLLAPLLLIVGYLNYDHFFGRYERLPADHLFKVRGERRRQLVELIGKGKVYTNLCLAETGYEEGVRFDELRLGRKDACVIAAPEEARAGFEKDPGPCVLYLSSGELEEK